MAGVGRRTLYRKSVTDEYLNSTPEPGENEEIALVQAPRGSNIIEIMLASGQPALAILPTRFRKLIWVKRGDYLITSTSAGYFETSAGEAGKVRHRVEHILNKDQIKYLKKKDLWPEGAHNDFGAAAAAAALGPIAGKDPRENWGQAIPSMPLTSNDDSKAKEDATRLKNNTGSESGKDKVGNPGITPPNIAEGRKTEGNGEGKGRLGYADRKSSETGEENEEEERSQGDSGEGLEHGDYDDEDDEDMSDLFVNNNRAAMMQLRTDYDDEAEDYGDSDDESDG